MSCSLLLFRYSPKTPMKIRWNPLSLLVFSKFSYKSYFSGISSTGWRSGLDETPWGHTMGNVRGRTTVKGWRQKGAHSIL